MRPLVIAQQIAVCDTDTRLVSIKVAAGGVVFVIQIGRAWINKAHIIMRHDRDAKLGGLNDGILIKTIITCLDAADADV